MQQQNGNETVG